MTFSFDFTLRGLAFDVRHGQIFLDDEPITLREVIQFARGRIDLTPPPQPTIAEVVVEASGADGFDDDTGDFDILREALEATDLLGTVADPAADLSVFAPTDAAFIDLAQSLGFEGTDEAEAFAAIQTALVGLTGSEEAALQLLADILLYHVAPGGRTLAELNADGTIATAFAGFSVESVGATFVDNDPSALDPTVIAADIQASNGVIQAIDRVLLPIDVAANDPTDSVAALAGPTGDFDILLQALTATGLATLFDGGADDLTDVTVFAPTDAAFGLLAQDLGFTGDVTDEDAVFGFIAGALEGLGASPEAALEILEDILLYHVSQGAKSASAIEAAEEIDTLLGETFETEDGALVDNEPDIEDPAIVIPDLLTTNVAVQVIDRVLLPVDLEANDPDETLVGSFRRDDLAGRGGDDTLFGRGGRDHLFGAGGDDELFGGRGRDRLDGGTGDDTMHGGRGADSFYFAAGGADVVSDFGRRDTLVFAEGQFATRLEALESAVQDGGDVLFSYDGGSARLLDTDLDHLDVHDVLIA